MNEMNRSSGDDADDRSLFRLGGAMAVCGSLVAIVGNALHPRSTAYYGDPVAWLNHNAPSSIWFPSHLMLLLASIMLIGLFPALSKSIAGRKGHGIGSVALAHALIGLALIIVTLAIDGLVVPKLADAWKVSATQTPDAVLAASIFYHTIFSLLYVFEITLFGFAPALYGVAIIMSGVYAAWLGRVGLVLGSSVVATALLSMLGVATEFMDAVVWSVVSSLVVIWFLIIGVLLWRRGSRKPSFHAPNAA